LQLQIASSGAANIVLTWPAFPSNIALEMISSIRSTNWTTVTNSPALVGNNYVLTNSAAGTADFFRLHIH
jgi:hypothetical protein